MIHIIADYYFMADGVQYTLLQTQNPKKQGKKQSYGKPLGYFTTLGHLLDRLVQIITAESKTDGEISEYIQALENNKKMLENLEQIKTNE